jgi:hypothetical protein
VSPTGQIEYGSLAFVRVLNDVVEYALVGTPGNLEADPAESLLLLRAVASRL